MYHMFKMCFPKMADAFENFIYYSTSFSRDETVILNEILKTVPDEVIEQIISEAGLKPRHRRQLLQKVGLNG